MMGEKKEFYHWIEDIQFFPKLKGKVLMMIYNPEIRRDGIYYMELAEVEQ